MKIIQIFGVFKLHNEPSNDMKNDHWNNLQEGQRQRVVVARCIRKMKTPTEPSDSQLLLAVRSTTLEIGSLEIE